VQQGLSVGEAREVWLDGYRHGQAARRRGVVIVYDGQPDLSPAAAAIWRDGWRHGVSERRAVAGIRRLYAGSPPQCPKGGPCIGREGCRAAITPQRDGTQN
jgi:hypothetical protein